MKPAKCSFCGAEEWRHVCGRKSGGDRKATPDITPAPRAERALASRAPVSQLASSTYRHRDAEKRREYQRDLMRSRRRAARRNQAGAA